MPRMPGRKEQFERLKPEQRLGDAPIEEHLHAGMVSAMEALDDVFNKGQRAPNKTTGIVMMFFPYGDKSGRCNYISNGADRRDVVTLMKEMIARFEGQPEMEGNA